MSTPTNGDTMNSATIDRQTPRAAPATGKAPAGMWWVAWRQHRLAILSSLALMAATAVVLVSFRLVFDSWLDTLGGRSHYLTCMSSDGSDTRSRGCAAVWSAGDPARQVWFGIRVWLIALPGLVGALVGAAVFARERERRTLIFSLTQSVSRTRWYWTKCAVVITPLTAGMIVVGLLTEWAADAYGTGAWPPVDVPTFQLQGLVPALIIVLVLGISLGAGTFFRSMLPALIFALALSAVAVVGIDYLGYPQLVPHNRLVAPPTVGYIEVPPGSLIVASGYLKRNGEPGFPEACPVPPGLDWAKNPDEAGLLSERAWVACINSQGLTKYVDYLDVSQRTRLTATLAGISILLSGAFLAVGGLRLRRRIL